MKAWWGRRSPHARGMIVHFGLSAAFIAAAIITQFPNNLGGPPWLGFLIGAGFGCIALVAGLHVRKVAQISLDLEADRKAMRDAIDRLERGR